MERELNRILSKNIEGYQGLEKASEYIEDKSIKNFIEALAKKKREQAEEVRDYMISMKIKPTESGTTLGQLHRAIMDVVGQVKSKQEAAIIKECIRGEKMAREEYEKALKSNTLEKDALNMAMKHRDRSIAAIQTFQKLSSVLV
jgi:uncharacterized protein (TIGR02284 family)